MLFLVIGRRRVGFVRAKSRARLLANLSSMRRLEKQRFFLFVGDFADGNGGLAIVNCRSNKELYDKLMSLPLGGDRPLNMSVDNTR